MWHQWWSFGALNCVGRYKTALLFCLVLPSPLALPLLIALSSLLVLPSPPSCVSISSCVGISASGFTLTNTVVYRLGCGLMSPASQPACCSDALCLRSPKKSRKPSRKAHNTAKQNTRHLEGGGNVPGSHGLGAGLSRCFNHPFGDSPHSSLVRYQ